MFKAKKSMASWLAATGMVVMFSACSSSEEKQGGDQLEADGQQGQQEGGEGENQADADAQEGNQANAQNQAQGENFQAQENTENQGEGVNNAEEEEVAQQNSGQEDLGASLNSAEEAPVEEVAVSDAPVNEAAAGQSANEIPAGPTTEAAPAAPAAPATGAIVRYASGKVDVFDQPNGAKVRELNKGDHPLVVDENGWMKMSDGRYIGAGSLQDKGVGRDPSGSDWN
jgi:hypothetical protein